MLPEGEFGVMSTKRRYPTDLTERALHLSAVPHTATGAMSLLLGAPWGSLRPLAYARSASRGPRAWERIIAACQCRLLHRDGKPLPRFSRASSPNAGADSGYSTDPL